ncbi:16058_t:CDS:2 [Funneliformis geosporum]|uniref:16058_t:CDS:1 n=1 Tax=Funneliformis geosporum TaxID=1117311 RepID=A0A9W4WSZ9_9GLOM|nr:16058_t:CDS:2 [Funneliformis geosporum]
MSPVTSPGGGLAVSRSSPDKNLIMGETVAETSQCRVEGAFTTEPKTDCLRARGWDQERSRKQVHINQPIVATVHGDGNITNIGDGNGGTIVSSKRDKEEEDERNQTKRVRFHEEKPPLKKKSKSGKKVSDTLTDGTKITKPSPINYAQTDEDDETATKTRKLCDSLDVALSNSKVWALPSGKNVGDIYSEKISENARTVKNKKRLTAIEKAILRYGASRIIDLSAHMKKWFCENDKKFNKKDYEYMLRVPEMTSEESSLF